MRIDYADEGSVSSKLSRLQEAITSIESGCVPTEGTEEKGKLLQHSTFTPFAPFTVIQTQPPPPPPPP